MNVPITQSREWQDLQNDLKTESFFEKTDDYQYLAIKKSIPTGNYLYCPYGPVADAESSLKNAFKSLQNLAKAHHSTFIRIEPQYQSKNLQKIAISLNLKLKKSTDLNPKETWLLDLTGNDIKDKLPSRLLRYYKTAEKNGITIETSHNPDDIHYLLDLQKALAKEKGINTFSEHYLKTELKQPFATLYLAKYNQNGWCAQGEERDRTRPNNVIAAGLVFDDKTTRYNLQGAQSDEGRKLHATGILTIKLILDAKDNNQKLFDFWGIAPEGAPATHPWAGFTNFKKTFKGYEKDYMGTYDLILNPTKYKLYKFLRKIRRLV